MNLHESGKLIKMIMIGGRAYLCSGIIVGHLNNNSIRLFNSFQSKFPIVSRIVQTSNLNNFHFSCQSLRSSTILNNRTIIKSLLSHHYSVKPSLLLETKCLVSFFSTKPNQEKSNLGSSEPKIKPKSVWKSSAKVLPSSSSGSGTENDALEGSIPLNAKSRMFDFDEDLSYIKEETTLYEMTNHTTYKMIFALVVIQYIFWTYCANVLYMFYAGVDEHGNKLRNLTKRKKEEQGDKASFLKTCREFMIANGYQTLVQGFFFLIGNMIAVGMMYMLSRFVTFIRVMPGGRMVKIGRLNMFGWPSQRNVTVYRVDDVYSTKHRLQRPPYMTIRVRDKTFSLLLDTSGKLENGEIFDKTLGVTNNFGPKNV